MINKIFKVLNEVGLKPRFVERCRINKASYSVVLNDTCISFSEIEKIHQYFYLAVWYSEAHEGLVLQLAPRVN